MVKKLFKHEFLALGRTLLPVQALVLVFSALARLVQLAETDTLVYNLLWGSIVFFLVVVNLINLSMPFVMGLIRFYKNLFTTEGYLSFTLPVTTTQHLYTKLLTTLGFSISAVISSILSLMIVTSGEVWTEIVISVRYLWSLIPGQTSAHIALYLLEFAVLLVITFAMELLLYYLFLSLGQLSKKNRLLSAFGFYFGYYVITQILGTVGSIVFSIFAESAALEAVGKWIAENAITFVHLLLCGLIVLSALFGWLYFAISNYVLRRKLNLE